MRSDLIYDVGMHNGDDTAFYLHQGYRVLAIEADPVQAKAGRQRFDSAIADGRLTILEVAIGPKQGVVPFWVSTNPEYNSFNRAMQPTGAIHATASRCSVDRSLMFSRSMALLTISRSISRVLTTTAWRRSTRPIPRVTCRLRRTGWRTSSSPAIAATYGSS
jgi:hypothetical protein